MKNFVTESRILSRTEISLAGRNYAEFEIAGDITFEPGQYLMLRTNTCKHAWPCPYPLIRKTEHGASVLADTRQDLYQCWEGDTIQYWGPRGTSPAEKDSLPVLAAEPAAYFLLYPFLTAGLCRKLLIFDTDGNAFEPDDQISAMRFLNISCSEQEKISGEFSVECFPDLIQTAKAALKEPGRVILALNPKNAEAFAEHTPDGQKDSVFLYISNKKACGIDSCKGCYLHDRDGGMGINVCCKGPFMPLSMIDFEKDGKSLEEFISAK